MALPKEVENRAERQGANLDATQEVTDQPLNYGDQARNINSRIRKLDLEWVAEATRDNIGAVSAALLLGGAAALFFKKRIAIASGLVVAAVLEQIVLKQLQGSKAGPRRRRSRKDDIELERYALKAERGDYGKIEVIPFK